MMRGPGRRGQPMPPMSMKGQWGLLLRVMKMVMKNYALPLFSAVPESNPRHDELVELSRAFDHFEAIDPELVPRSSLLREFIGGGSYKYH